MKLELTLTQDQAEMIVTALRMYAQEAYEASKHQADKSWLKMADEALRLVTTLRELEPR